MPSIIKPNDKEDSTLLGLVSQLIPSINDFTLSEFGEKTHADYLKYLCIKYQKDECELAFLKLHNEIVGTIGYSIEKKSMNKENAITMDIDYIFVKEDKRSGTFPELNWVKASHYMLNYAIQKAKESKCTVVALIPAHVDLKKTYKDAGFESAKNIFQDGYDWMITKV